MVLSKINCPWCYIFSVWTLHDLNYPGWSHAISLGLESQIDKKAKWCKRNLIINKPTTHWSVMYRAKCIKCLRWLEQIPEDLSSFSSSITFFLHPRKWILKGNNRKHSAKIRSLQQTRKRASVGWHSPPLKKVFNQVASTIKDSF